jgi:hypothetical protein
MASYDFSLRFKLPDADADPEQFLEALAEAGCDDAMVGVGQRGRIAPCRRCARPFPARRWSRPRRISSA